MVYQHHEHREVLDGPKAGLDYFLREMKEGKQEEVSRGFWEERHGTKE
jgi:hypothetical protein